MLFMGTKGLAANELENGFHLGSSNRKVISNNFKEIIHKYKNNQQLQIFNKIYLDILTKVNKNFQNESEKNFLSEIETIDLKKYEKSANQINKWIIKNTNGKIQKLFDSNDCNSDTRLLLLNVIYFKGHWKFPFNKELTQKDNFWITDNESIQIDMMIVRNKFKIKGDRNLNAMIIEIPYAESDLSILLLIPIKRNGLHNLELKLKETNLTELSKGLVERNCELALPKFKIGIDIDLKDVLKLVR